jgi:hypothetical protein
MLAGVATLAILFREEARMKRLPAQSVAVARYTLRVPGVVARKDIGLGDVVKRATRAIGYQPCAECEQRAATLNRWLVFSGRRRV